MKRPPMEEVHERMKELCKFFPEAEPLTMEDEYDYEDEVVSFLEKILEKGVLVLWTLVHASRLKSFEF